MPSVRCLLPRTRKLEKNGRALDEGTPQQSGGAGNSDCVYCTVSAASTVGSSGYLNDAWEGLCRWAAHVLQKKKQEVPRQPFSGLSETHGKRYLGTV